MNRGTEAIWPSDGGFTVLCDCGTATQVVVDVAGPEDSEHVAVAPQEIAVTCSGCGSAHWLTIIPALPPADDPVVTV